MRLITILSAACVLFVTGGCAGTGWHGQSGMEAASSPVSPPSRVLNAEQVAAEVVEEVNFARTAPQRYTRFLESRLADYQGTEGTSALREAIKAMEHASPVHALQVLRELEAAARVHVADQAQSGETGHVGSDGSAPFERIRRHVPANGAGENIAYGLWNARDIVMELIIDDGIADRGHRRNILSPSYALIGVAIGEHPQYGIMAVMDFAYPITSSSR